MQRELRVLLGVDAKAAGPTARLPTTAPTPVTRNPHRSRRIALGVGEVANTLALAAAASVSEAPEYVDTIPPKR